MTTLGPRQAGPHRLRTRLVLLSLRREALEKSESSAEWMEREEKMVSLGQTKGAEDASCTTYMRCRISHVYGYKTPLTLPSHPSRHP